MPTTNRPFFANFFAAFRAHTALQKAPPAIYAPSHTTSTGAASPTSPAAAAYTTLSRDYHTSTSPDSHPQPSQIPLKPGSSTPQSTHSHSPHTNASVATAPPQSHFRSSRPLHAPNGTPQSRGRMRSHSREPVYGPHPQPQPQSLDASTPPFPSRTPSPGVGASSPAYGFPRGRRGSDSSAHSNGSGSGNTAVGMLSTSPPPSMAEKWYIGGRTAQGEERFYKLGLVRSSGSADRLSLDRLSL